MKRIILPLILLALAASFSGCKKWSLEHHDIYNYTPPAANPISADKPLDCSGTGSTVIAAKGTMLSGKTYTVATGCDLVINPLDTLLMQPGVNLIMGANSSIIALGTFVSNGSKLQPNSITVAGITKKDAPGQVAPAQDPAYSAVWKGLIGGPTCNLMVLRWTQIEFAGATEGGATSTIANRAEATSTLFFLPIIRAILYGRLVLYGGNDDPIRISAGPGGVFS